MHRAGMVFVVVYRAGDDIGVPGNATEIIPRRRWTLDIADVDVGCTTPKEHSNGAALKCG